MEPTPDELIPGARIVADAYHQATGQPITVEALAERLRIPVATAERLHAALTVPQPIAALAVPARHNYTPTMEALA